MMQFVIAAPRSGSGKTTVTCALLAALKKRGMDLRLQERAGLHRPHVSPVGAGGGEPQSGSLSFCQKYGTGTVRPLCCRARGCGVRRGHGFLRWAGPDHPRSAWELTDALDLPVLLVVQPKGASVTLAAEIQGLVHFKPESHIAGILLNDCSEKLFRMLKPLLETETGLPVLGYLPRLPQAVVESRHLA